VQFVDANIFIRFLTADDPEKAAACYRLFEQAKHNEIELTTSDAVIAEVVFVLSSKRLYDLARQDVRIRLYPILTLPGLRLSHRDQFLRALDLFSRNTIDFEDALSIAAMERQSIQEIYSYDRDFDAVQGSSIRRIEP
jgi:predicted nucleic acid-binding protein